jgi:hypothetical protein
LDFQQQIKISEISFFISKRIREKCKYIYISISKNPYKIIKTNTKQIDKKIIIYLLSTSFLTNNSLLNKGNIVLIVSQIMTTYPIILNCPIQLSASDISGSFWYTNKCN